MTVKPCLPPKDTMEPVSFEVPSLACDCHAHIIGPDHQYPLAAERSYTPPENPLENYLSYLKRIGFERGVLVTPSPYGTDNATVIDALKMQPHTLRGIAVADANTSAQTLQQWKSAGVSGLRFNLYAVGGAKVYKNGVGLDALKALAPSMHDLGLHAQIWVHAPDLVELAPELEQLKLPLVIDHMGRMNAALGRDNPGFQKLCQMLSAGTAWTKLSGADRNTNGDGQFEDIDQFAQALLAANPEQIVWGADWPHTNYFDPNRVPDDGALLNTLYRWAPSASLRKKILTDNPQRLYGF
jgi:2-pyrone-4,6-dicarboxylate lactonase